MRMKVGLMLLLLLCSVTLMAQNTMRVHYKDGREQDIPIEQVDSVTFVKGDDTASDPCWRYKYHRQLALGKSGAGVL